MYAVQVCLLVCYLIYGRVHYLVRFYQVGMQVWNMDMEILKYELKGNALKYNIFVYCKFLFISVALNRAPGLKQFVSLILLLLGFVIAVNF